MDTLPSILERKILIVDDQPANVALLETLLGRVGYSNVDSTMDPATVADLHRAKHYDLILLDILMPEFDGFQVMESLNKPGAKDGPSILVVTSQPSHKLRAMQAGARDFISKPFDNSEVLTRIHYVLEVDMLRAKEQNYSRHLEETVLKRTAELRRSEEMFRELVANIPEALWIRDTDRQTIEYVNPAWKKLSGLTVVPGDPVAKGHQAIHPEDMQWLANERRKGSGGRTNAEYRLLRPDQSVRWVSTRTFPIANPSGKAPWLVEIIEDVTLRREAQKQLVHLARHDALTGLPNRALLYESLQDALVQAREDSSAVSLLLVDVDQFKTVNDTLGHAAGDELLREFAARLAKCVRPGDMVGRLGGDEFGAIVMTPANSQAAADVANRVCATLRSPFLLEGKDVQVTASIGIANCPADASDTEALMRCADTAMYAAKAAGRNTFRSFTAEMNNRAIEKANMQGALRLALGRDEFVLHYQPKVRIGSERCTSVEALIRWNRPGCNLVSPAAFIPSLEEMGLIVPVGAWVIETACRQIRDWELSGFGQVSVAVNVSSRQLREERFVAQVAESARKHRIDPKLLEIEITESTLMADDGSAEDVLRHLKELGVSISIDDFGTGYSSLAYLKRFQVDTLKIDRAFIRDVTASADAATMTIAIINMAHNLRLKVIAEGVETKEQLEFLRAHGCDEVQGYLLSMPLPVDQLSEKLSPNVFPAAALPPLPHSKRNPAHV